jgi:hypothetical protein
MSRSEQVARGIVLRATVGSTVHGLHHGGQDDRCFYCSSSRPS